MNYKCRLTLWLFVLMCTTVGAQVTPHYATVEKYNATLQPFEKHMYLPVNFDAFTLLNSISDSLNDATIKRIDLVYTTYRLDPNFNQALLNNNRTKALLKALPIANDELISWRYVGQTNATTPESAKAMFHGFVVYYQERPSKESVQQEIAFLNSYLKSESVAKPKKSATSSTTNNNFANTLQKAGIPKSIAKSSNITLYNENSKCIETITQIIYGTKDVKDKRIDSIYALENLVGVSQHIEAVPNSVVRKYTIKYQLKKDSCADEPVVIDQTKRVAIPKNWDTKSDFDAVAAVFNRYPNWSNSVVVMDVTGSMSPYLAKTMVWLKATHDSSRIKAFVFFNDGDGKRDKEKVTGKVGGVYNADNTSFKDVYKTMITTMQKGGGGDRPENNLEATIKALALYPNTTEVILVVDNFATPRDLKLAKKIKQPLHIILCGANDKINKAYVQLAYNSGGWVHTLTQDLHLKGMASKTVFSLGNNQFKLMNGRVLLMPSKGHN